MTDTTNTPSASAVLAGNEQPNDTQAPALPAGVTREQYDAAVLDAQARGLDTNAPANDRNAQSAADGLVPAASPEHYDLSQYPVDDSDGDAAGSMEFDSWRRSALQAAGFPRDMAGGMIAACVDAEKRFANQTSDQKEIQIRGTHAAMARLWGDRTQANIELANKFLDHVEAKSPGVLAYLDASGAANDIGVIAAVVGQAERYLATGGKL